MLHIRIGKYFTFGGYLRSEPEKPGPHENRVSTDFAGE
jgi:hypothetical protein